MSHRLHRLHRRDLLRAGLALAAWPWLPRAARAQESPVHTAVRERLENSEYVYVSPLKQDGGESTCHGEVWYGWIDGSVAIITGRDRWKSRAIDRGLDTARIWVGDYGRWKGLVSYNEDFRKGPSFEARAKKVKDPALVDRLLAIYDRKYPEEIGAWREKMKQGTESGERVLILYTPIQA